MGKASRKKKEQRAAPPPTQQQIAQQRQAEAENVRAKTRTHVSQTWLPDKNLERLIQTLRHAYSAADGHVGKVFQSLTHLQQAGHRHLKIDCHKGCGYCCHTEVTASAVEIVAIKDHIEQNFSPEQKQALLERMSARNHESETMTDIEKADAIRACPLLESNECSIYAVRPFTCRSHYSMDVNACRRIYEGESGTVPVIAEFAGLIQALRQGFMEGVEAAGSSAEPLWLSEGLALAFEEGRIESWRRGEGAFSPASKAAFEKQMAQSADAPVATRYGM